MQKVSRSLVAYVRANHEVSNQRGTSSLGDRRPRELHPERHHAVLSLRVTSTVIEALCSMIVAGTSLTRPG